MGVPVVVPAAPDDAPHLAYVIATAFRDLAPSRWLVGNEPERVTVLAGVFALYVEHALRHGRVYTTPGRDAAAVWLPVTGAGAMMPDDYPRRLEEATGPWVVKFAVFDALLHNAHPTARAHDHLALLAVHPTKQGQGIGRALLDAHHCKLDREQIPAYLEASDAATKNLYTRYGYARLPGPAIELPGGPLMYPMWRNPAGNQSRPA